MQSSRFSLAALSSQGRVGAGLRLAEPQGLPPEASAQAGRKAGHALPMVEWKPVGRRAKAWVLMWALAGLGLRLASPLLVRAQEAPCCSSASCCHSASCPMHVRPLAIAQAHHLCHGSEKADSRSCTCSLQSKAPASALLTGQADFRFQLPSASPTLLLANSGLSASSDSPSVRSGYTSPPDQPPRRAA